MHLVSVPCRVPAPLAGFSDSFELRTSSSQQLVRTLRGSCGILGEIPVSLTLFHFACTGGLRAFVSGVEIPNCEFTYSVGLG